MPSIPYAKSSYERTEGNLPPLDCVNMYVEVPATDMVGACLQSRPGLDDRSADMGAGPIKQLFKRDGVFSGALFGVSDGNLYQDTTNRGAISGSGPVSIAGNEIGLMVAAGGGLRYWNGTTLAVVTFPDSADVTKVFAGGSRFWFIREDTGKIYWTDSLEADVESLDFATAESLPDKLLDGLWVDGMAVLFGAETVELWQQTGDSTLPIRPMVNLVYEKGIKATGCAAAIGSTFAWVGNDNVVYLSDEKTPISNEGLNARIAASTNVSLFTFPIDGVEFLALRLDTETQVWRSATQTWHEFATYGQTNWAAACYAGGVFGSGIDGKTLAWGTDKTDVSATSGIMERKLTAGFAINGGGQSINSLQVRMNPGETPYLSGDYAEPVLEMRLSRDGGRTWGDWRSRGMGAAGTGASGEYRTKVEWRALGLASRPGFLVQLRTTDPVPFRVSDVLVNEGWGGR
jgi:hypothetical protein